MVHIEILEVPNTEEPMAILCTSLKPSWMDPTIDYLKLGTLPTDSSTMRKVKCLTPHYTLIKGKLYKRSYFFSFKMFASIRGGLHLTRSTRGDMQQPSQRSSARLQDFSTRLLLANNTVGCY